MGLACAETLWVPEIGVTSCVLRLPIGRSLRCRRWHPRFRRADTDRVRRALGRPSVERGARPVGAGNIVRAPDLHRSGSVQGVRLISFTGWLSNFDAFRNSAGSSPGYRWNPSSEYGAEFSSPTPSASPSSPRCGIRRRG